MNKRADFQEVKRVIEGCETLQQSIIAMQTASAYLKKWPFEPLTVNDPYRDEFWDLRNDMYNRVELSTLLTAEHHS